ncbi:MAG: secondary thiamine-phosphate synthase enzyme YjbQ [Trueperaceae bacterium]|nr:secondary thiamine-phosphate synthase enzyme YjbQ [Trueperaceae bacterium]
MLLRQTPILLSAKPRGFHLITAEVLGQLDLSDIEAGIVHLFIQHTSASLSLNENASADVRRDFERFFRQAIPDDSPYFEHTYEGPDDMTAHLKASLLGSSLTLPISQGRLALGTWQGIYLGEHREHGGRRRLLVTYWGSQIAGMNA